MQLGVQGVAVGFGEARGAPDLHAGAQQVAVLELLQLSERIAGALHAGQLGLVPPQLNQEQSQLLWLTSRPAALRGAPERNEKKYLRTT